MAKFYKYLLSSKASEESIPIKYYTVLGLGDSNYKKFNFIGKVLHRRLEQLGCECIFDPGWADESHQKGSEAVVLPWVKGGAGDRFIVCFFVVAFSRPRFSTRSLCRRF